MRALRSWSSLLSCALALSACSEPIALEWQYDIGAGSVSTPLVTSAFIAFGSERGVTILEPTGKLRCQFDARGEVISKPASDGRLVFFGSTNYIFYAIDTNCRETWKLATRDRIKSDPALADGRVLVSSYDGHVYALAAGTGELAWTFPAAPAKVEPPPPAAALVQAPPSPPLVVGDFSYSSPVVADGVIYLGNLDQHVYAIDLATGALRWRFKTGGAITSTPLAAGGTLYFGSNDGCVYALDLGAAEPRERWRYNTHDWVNSSPRLADGVIYVGSNDRHVYALDAASGQLEWAFETKGPAIAIPAVYKNLVLAAGGSGDGAIYALDRVAGALFWERRTSGKIESDPIVIDDRLYVTSTDHALYAFRIRATTTE